MIAFKPDGPKHSLYALLKELIIYIAIAILPVAFMLTFGSTNIFKPNVYIVIVLLLFIRELWNLSKISRVSAIEFDTENRDIIFHRSNPFRKKQKSIVAFDKVRLHIHHYTPGVSPSMQSLAISFRKGKEKLIEANKKHDGFSTEEIIRIWKTAVDLSFNVSIHFQMVDEIRAR